MEAMLDDRIGAEAPPGGLADAAGPSGVPWQVALKQAIRDPVQLCRLLRLPLEFEAAAVGAAADFPVFVPWPYLARIRPGDPADPLLRQVLPLAEELVSHQGFTVDPVGDRAAQGVPGLLTKYASRALILATPACAVHCRYCFRRHFAYTDPARPADHFQPAIDALAGDSTFSEVILSGGDPLTLPDGQLADLADRLAVIGHLKRLRVHTRLPVMIPQRVTESLLAGLCGTRLTPIVVLHVNHARELEDTVAAAVARLAAAGVVLLNQSVLLRGVNDSIDALADLSERLVDLRVMPYYLHQLDRVAGAAHFEVPEAEGRALVAGLRERLPGYAVPRYVREVPGAPAKVPLV